MRNLLILARKHGGKKLDMISGPGVPVNEQRQKWNALLPKLGHEKYEYVELWDSDGRREAKFLSVEAAHAQYNQLKAVRDSMIASAAASARKHQNQIT